MSIPNAGTAVTRFAAAESTKECSAPNPVSGSIVAVQVSLKKLAEAPRGEENADDVPAEKKHEDEARSCNQVN